MREGAEERLTSQGTAVMDWPPHTVLWATQEGPLGTQGGGVESSEPPLPESSSHGWDVHTGGLRGSPAAAHSSILWRLGMCGVVGTPKAGNLRGFLQSKE